MKISIDDNVGEKKNEYKKLIQEFNSNAGRTLCTVVDESDSECHVARNVLSEMAKTVALRAIDIVRYEWLERCLQQRQFTKPTVDVIFKGLEGATICTTGFSCDEEHDGIIEKVEKLGGTVSLQLDRRVVDVLICKHTHSKKYKQAIKWSIPTVDKKWLDCIQINDIGSIAWGPGLVRFQKIDDEDMVDERQIEEMMSQTFSQNMITQQRLREHFEKRRLKKEGETEDNLCSDTEVDLDIIVSTHKQLPRPSPLSIPTTSLQSSIYLRKEHRQASTQNQSQHVASQSQMSEKISTKSCHVFQGMRFIISDITPAALIPVAQKLVEDNGGKIVDTANIDSDLDTLIIMPLRTEIHKIDPSIDRMRMVTLKWLYTCSDHSTIIPLKEKGPPYRPIFVNTLATLAEYEIQSVTGKLTASFMTNLSEESVKFSDLYSIMDALGGCFTNTISKDVTDILLVDDSDFDHNSERYQTFSVFMRPIVRMKWLHECMKQGHFVGLGPYTVNPDKMHSDISLSEKRTDGKISGVDDQTELNESSGDEGLKTVILDSQPQEEEEHEGEEELQQSQPPALTSVSKTAPPLIITSTSQKEQQQQQESTQPSQNHFELAVDSMIGGLSDISDHSPILSTFAEQIVNHDTRNSTRTLQHLQPLRNMIPHRSMLEKTDILTYTGHFEGQTKEDQYLDIVSGLLLQQSREMNQYDIGCKPDTLVPISKHHVSSNILESQVVYDDRMPKTQMFAKLTHKKMCVAKVSKMGHLEPKIVSLGGEYTSGMSVHCTHCICDTSVNNARMFAAIVGRLKLIKPAFVEDSFIEGRWLAEDKYLVTDEELMVASFKSFKTKQTVERTFRESGVKVYASWKVLIRARNTKRKIDICAILDHGGATWEMCESFGPRERNKFTKSASPRFTHVMYDQSVTRSENAEALLQEVSYWRETNIAVVTVSFLQSYLIDPNVDITIEFDKEHRKIKDRASKAAMKSKSESPTHQIPNENSMWDDSPNGKDDCEAVTAAAAEQEPKKPQIPRIKKTRSPRKRSRDAAMSEEDRVAIESVLRRNPRRKTRRDNDVYDLT